jgi:hypothetical protein
MKQLVWLLGQVNDRRLIQDLLETRPRDPEETVGRTGLEDRLEKEIQEILEESRELVRGPLSRIELETALEKLRRRTP